MVRNSGPYKRFPMAETYQATRRVEFRDTDAAGIMHFSAYIIYMEEVEHEFLRHIGLSVHHDEGETLMSWPRVSVHCDYRGPVRFEDVLEINLSVSAMGTKSVAYQFDFSHQGRPVASGQTTAVCCRLETDKPPKSMPIPDWFRDKLLPYLADDPDTFESNSDTE